MTAEELELRLLLEAIFLKYHYDFRSYALASLTRRVHAALTRLGYGSISQLKEAILDDGRVFTQLLAHLTVQVSEVFRDPAVWRVFRQKVVPELATHPSFRIWVAGCSAGEESYSYAIALREEGLLDRATIYATDINPVALAKAEAGTWSRDRIAQFAKNYVDAGGTSSLDAHFTVRSDVAVFDDSLRARMMFADHSLATDSVFAEMNVVSCRNVLIYFDRSLQDKALSLMSASLGCRGFLALGPRETLRFSSASKTFDAFDEETRWFRKR